VAELGRLLDQEPGRLDAPDGRGRTLLHWAAYHGKARAVEALLARGASPDERGGLDEAPLHAAARGVQVNERFGLASRDVALLLLDAGAAPSPRDASGRTPLDLAIRVHRVKPAFISLLESRGARATPIPGEER
jgi:ankyrin repeat protein